MVLNYYSPLRLIRGIAPGMLERGDGHIINVATWGVFSEPSPLFAVYNASKAALSAVSRVIETEWATKGVHSTTLYYPLVATPMIAPTKEYQGLPALTSEEAAGWMITAARTRPVRIAPRMALAAQAIDTVVPGLATNDDQTAAAPAQQAGVIDTTAWRFSPAGCCFGRRTTSGR